MFFFYRLALNSNMSIAPVVYIRVLRNSVLHMLFHSGNVKDVHLISTSTSTIKRCFFLLAGLQFKHVHLPQKFHGNENLPSERPYGTWNILRERETIIISWIWLNGLHTYIGCCKLQVIVGFGSRILSKLSTKTATTILFHSTDYLSFI